MFLNDSQRKNTKYDERLASLIIMRNINESIIVAIIYGFHIKISNERNVLYFAFGKDFLYITTIINISYDFELNLLLEILI